MAAESGTSVQATFKDVYVGTELMDRVPDDLLVQNIIPFDSKNRNGDDYIIPVLLRRPFGGTRESGTTALTDFTLRSPTASATAQASLKPATYIGRGQIPYLTGWRTKDNPKGAFQEDTEIIVNAHKATAHFEKEIDLIYGGTHLGTIDTITSAVSTTLVVVVSAATWAPGIWAQYEGASFDIYDSALSSKTNSNAEMVLSSVDPDTRTLTFTGNATDVGNVTTTMVIVPVASVGKVMTGLVKIVSNTTTLFGINGATYQAWRGNSYAVGGALTMGKLGNACLRSSTRTLVGNWKVLVSPYTWQDLGNDAMSLRRFTEDTKSEIGYGTQKLSFVGAGGSMEIMPYPLIKAGEAIAFRVDHFRRIGSTQFEFKTVDAGSDPRYLAPVADKAAYEFRYGWDEALFCDWPGANVHLTGIVNASLS